MCSGGCDIPSGRTCANRVMMNVEWGDSGSAICLFWNEVTSGTTVVASTVILQLKVALADCGLSLPEKCK